MDPFSWIALALMAAGTAANAKAQHDTNRARSKVFGEEAQRRKELQDKAQATAQATADQLTASDQREKQRAAQLADTYAVDTAATPTTTDSGTRFLDTEAPTQSTRTVEETAKQITKGRERANTRSAGQSKIQAFGDVFGEDQRFAARNQQDIGQNIGFMKSWQENVMPALVQKANMAGHGWATAGDVMKMVGTLMSVGALSGAGAANAGAGAGAGAGGNAAESTAGVLGRMGGTPYEFAGKDLFGMGKMGLGWGNAAGAASGAAGAATAAPMFNDMFEGDILKYLNDPALWGKQGMPNYWNYYK